MAKETKTIVLLLILGIVAYLIAYLFNAFISQHLSPADYGDFSIAIRTISVISLVLLLGTNISSVKYLSTYFNSENRDHIIQFIKWNLGIVSKTSIICIVIFILFYLLLAILHIYNIKDFTTHHFSIYVLWLAPFSAFYLLLASFILSDKKSILSFIITKIALNILLSLLLYITIYYIDVSVHFILILILLFIAFCVIIIGELYLVSKILTNNNISLKLKPDKSFKQPIKKTWMLESLKVTSGQIVFSLISVADLFIIEWIHPSEHATGYYAAMLVIVNILWVVPSSITSFLAPRLNPMFEHKRYKKLQNLINSINSINLPVLVILTLLIIIFSDYLLSFFGKDYIQAQTPLVILCIAYFLLAISLSNARILMFLESKKLMRINSTELIILVTTSIVLTYYFGILGMSFSVLITNIYKATMLFKSVKKILPIKPFTII